MGTDSARKLILIGRRNIISTMKCAAAIIAFAAAVDAFQAPAVLPSFSTSPFSRVASEQLIMQVRPCLSSSDPFVDVCSPWYICFWLA